MGDSVFDLKNLRSEIDVGPSAYFPASFTRRSSTSRTVAQSFQRRDVITCIAEHEELSADDVQGDLGRAVQTAQALQAKSIGRVIHSLKQSQQVYVAFVMDTTGSMDEHLDEVKSQITTIASTFESLGLVLHVGFVGYKDHGDDPSIQTFPFTTNVADFQSFVRAIVAIGGDDAPEDVLGGLWAAATQLPWEPDCTNVLFHIGDYPPHGTTYWNGHDLFPSGHPRDQSPAAIFGQLNALNVRYYFGKVTACTDTMLQVFQSYTEVTVFHVGDPVNVGSSVVTATQESVACSQQRALRGGRDLAHKYDTRVPKWSTLKCRQAALARYVCDAATLSMEDLTAPMTTFLRKSDVRIASLPFARGCERAAFYAQESTSDSKASGKGAPKWERMVAKRFLRELATPGEGGEGRYMKAMEGQAMAAALAKKFTKLMATGQLPVVSLSFLEASVAKLGNSDEFAAMERYLPCFTRFSNNLDWVSPLVASDRCVQFAVAFSHWTWVATNGYLMVVDLQGQQVDDHTLVLTDPAIHCTDAVRFAGGTNLGQRGMDEFFATHDCNEYCEQFNLLRSRPPEQRYGMWPFWKWGSKDK